MSVDTVRRTVARGFASVVLAVSVLIFALEDAFNLYVEGYPELAAFLLYWVIPRALLFGAVGYLVADLFRTVAVAIAPVESADG